MIGTHVKNQSGDSLGEIRDVKIDMDEGCIAYAVLSLDEVSGAEDRLLAVPWKALTLKPRERTVVLNVDEEKFKNAPAFENEHWPDMANREWGAEVHSYYGLEPYWRKPT